jgi:signal transduction histidine kinase
MGEQLADMEVKYETEKKEKEIEHLGKENSEKELELAKKREQMLLISGISLFVLILLVTLYFYNASRRHRELVEKEKELSAVKQQKQKEIIETIIVTEEKQRKKIASDLHDGLGQILTAAKINLSNVLSERKEPNGLGAVAELINSALQESKSMALNLMPLELKEKGLTESIKNICSRFNKPGTQEISFNTFGVPDKLDPVIEVNTYRICQELLNNAVKYSKASRIFLQLFCRDHKLIIQIEDNGIGFDKSAVKQNSLGMNTLRERVALLKGDIELDTAPQKGTNIFIELAL